MKEIMPSTYILLIISMAGFVFGMLLYRNNSSLRSIESNEKLITNGIKLLNNPLIILIYLFTAILLYKYAMNALVLAALNESTIAGEHQLETVFEGSGFAKNYYTYIAFPFVYISCSLLGLTLLNPSRKYWKFYVTFPIFLVCYMILQGGRVTFVVLVMYLVTSIVFLNASLRKIHIPVKYYIIGIPTALVMLLGMALQTGYRTTGEYGLDGKSISESAYEMSEKILVYSVIPIKLFDVALETKLPDKLGSLNMGRATIAGTDFIIQRGIFRLTGTEYKSTNDIILFLQNDWKGNIIPGKLYNYCYTGAFIHYLDFGIFGVFFFPFIFGFAFRHYILKFQQFKHLSDYILVGFGFYMMMHSLFTCYFIKAWVLFFVLMMVIISHAECRSKKNHQNY